MSLSLTATQLARINQLYQENQDTAHPYASVYAYIAEQMGRGLIAGYSEDQLYWFKAAAAVNRDDESAPAGFFIRDVTRLGMGLSSNSDPAIDNASNAIGQQVLPPQGVRVGSSQPIRPRATSCGTDPSKSMASRRMWPCD